MAIVLTALLCELIACFPGWLISSIRRIGSVGLSRLSAHPQTRPGEHLTSSSPPFWASS